MTIEPMVKRAFNRFGLDIRRLKNVPGETFLGLSARHIDTVLDVGSNNGGFAKWITRFAPRATLHCFEPLPGPCAELRKWGEKVRGTSIQVHQVAVSDHEGETILHEHLDHSTSSSVLANTQAGEELFPETRRTVERRISLTTMDAWSKVQGAAALGRILLKLDVQGLEDRVLRGAEQTLGQVDICIVEVSIVELYVGQATFADLVRMLAAAGLQYFGNLEQIHDEHGAPVYVDCVFVRRSLDHAGAKD